MALPGLGPGRARARFARWLGEGGAPLAAADAGLPALCGPRGPKSPVFPAWTTALLRLALRQPSKSGFARLVGLLERRSPVWHVGEVARAVGTSLKGEADLEPDIPGLTRASLKELDKTNQGSLGTLNRLPFMGSGP